MCSFCILSSPEPKARVSYCHHSPSGVGVVHLSRTTRTISTKLGRKHAWGIGFQICSNKDPIRGKIRKILINLQNLIFSWTTGWTTLIFGMEHPWGKEIQVCSNVISGV